MPPAEIIWQMRGEAEDCQINPTFNARLVQSGRGNVAGETAIVAVRLLLRKKV